MEFRPSADEFYLGEVYARVTAASRLIFSRSKWRLVHFRIGAALVFANPAVRHRAQLDHINKSLYGYAIC